MALVRGGGYYKQLRKLVERVDAKKKFIPDGDSDFAAKARNFAAKINFDPGKFHVVRG